MQTRLPNRRGFTLVELLVVISIILIMASLTVMVVNTVMNGDKISSSASSLQAAASGAVSRAIHAGRADPTNAARGFRLIVDPANPTTANSFIYIGSVEFVPAGTCTLGYPDLDNDNDVDDNNNDMADNGEDVARTLRGNGTFWYRLAQRGLLVNGTRMRLGVSKRWYTVDLSRLDDTHEILILTTDYQSAPLYDWTTADALDIPHAFPAGTVPGTYTFDLSPVVLAGQEPQRLASGIVVDLARSRYGSSSAIPTSDFANGYFDVLYTPRGGVSGSLGARGLVHFYLCELGDVIANRDPADPAGGDELIVTLFTQTGHVAVFPVDPTDVLINASGMSGTDGQADDPFRYAREGAVAGR